MTLETIHWEGHRSSKVEVCDKPIVNLAKRLVFTPGNGQLIAPPGWRKLAKVKLTRLRLSYAITSLVEQQIPMLTGEESTIEEQRIMNQFFWKSNQHRLEIYTSQDKGASWGNMDFALPCKRPAGFPVNSVDLLASLGGEYLCDLNTRIAVGFRDVGYGLPKQNEDSYIVSSSCEISEMMYPMTTFSQQTTATSYITQLTAASSSAFKSICPVRAGRKTLFFAATGGATTLFTVRYGAPADITAASFTMRGGESIGGIGNYTGEVSFSASATLNTSLTVTEVIS